MHKHKDLDSHTVRYFTEIIPKSGHDPEIFRVVSVKNKLVVENAI